MKYFEIAFVEYKKMEHTPISSDDLNYTERGEEREGDSRKDGWISRFELCPTGS